MPTHHHRSRQLNRKKKKLPGGRLTTHYSQKKAGRPICGSCGKHLQGVSMSKAKSKRRPERPFGGVLCFNCLQKMMIEKARATEGEK